VRSKADMSQLNLLYGKAHTQVERDRGGKCRKFCCRKTKTLWLHAAVSVASFSRYSGYVLGVCRTVIEIAYVDLFRILYAKVLKSVHS